MRLLKKWIILNLICSRIVNEKNREKIILNMTDKPRIAIDLDNVLLDSDSNIRQLIFEETGIESTVNDITDYSYAKSLNLDSKTMKRVLDRFHLDLHLSALNPILGAQNAMSILKLEYEPIIVTSRPVDTYTATEKSIKMWFGDIPLVHSNKKSDLCKKLKIETIIEDHPDTAIQCAYNQIKVFLMDYPWNYPIVDGGLLTRVSNWDMIIDYLFTVYASK